MRYVALRWILAAALVAGFGAIVSAQKPDGNKSGVGKGIDVEPMLSAKKGQFRAVLVGVNDYERLKDLNFCEEDVRGLRDQLIKMGFRRDTIKCLTTGDPDPAYRPNYRNISERLNAVFSGLDKDSVLVIALSGHGGSFEFRERSGEESKASFYCPQDARIHDPRGTMIPVKSIYDRLEKCPARFKMLLVDACRDPHIAPSGARTAIDEAKSMAGFAKSLSDGILPKGTLALVSCTSGEQSYEDPQLKHGIFMHYLLEGLAGRADATYRGNRNGMVSYRELKDYVYRKTSDHAWRKYDQPQTPEFLANIWELSDFDLSPAMLVIEARKAKQRGDSFFMENKWEKALKEYDHAITLDPTNTDVLVLKARVNLMLGNLKAALAVCDSVIEIDGNHTAALYYRCFAINNERKEIIKELKRIDRFCSEKIGRIPDNVAERILRSEINSTLGLMTQQEEYFEKAVSDAAKSIELDPQNVEAYRLRAIAYNNLDQYDKAIDDCNTAIALYPKSADLYRVRAYACAGRGRWGFGDIHYTRKAAEDSSKAIELDPQNVVAYRLRAIAYNNLDQYDKAIEDCNTAIALNPNHGAIYRVRAYAYNKKSEWDRAYDDANKAILLDPKNGLAYSMRGKARNGRGKYGQAIEDYNLAIELQPKDADAYNNRGNSYYNKADYDRAIEDYNRAIELQPKYIEAYNNRADAYEKLGMKALAEKDRKEAQDIVRLRD